MSEDSPADSTSYPEDLLASEPPDYSALLGPEIGLDYPEDSPLQDLPTDDTDARREFTSEDMTAGGVDDDEGEEEEQEEVLADALTRDSAEDAMGSLLDSPQYSSDDSFQGPQMKIIADKMAEMAKKNLAGGE